MMAEPRDLYQGQTVTPIPDPTTLTTEALHREVAMLKELFQEKVSTLEKRLEAAQMANEKLSTAQHDAFLATIGRGEHVMGKQFDQISLLLQTNTAVAIQISDIKERLTKIEGKSEWTQAAQIASQGGRPSRRISADNVIAVTATILASAVILALVLIAALRSL